MDSIAKITALAQKATGKTQAQLLAEAEITQPKNPPEAEQIELPLLPEGTTATANSLLRCSLFAATKRGQRPYLKRRKLHSADSISIVYTGARLDQADLDVYQQCIYLLSYSGSVNTIKFTARSFLKEIGREGGGKDQEWLKDAIARLTACSIEISDGKKTYFGSLVEGGKRNEETGFYEIQLNKNLMGLYKAGNWTGIDTNQRKALRGKSLALWLSAFYATHESPYPYGIEKLMHLSGSENTETKDFKRKLANALLELNTKTNWYWEIRGDNLHVFKNAKQLASSTK